MGLLSLFKRNSANKTQKAHWATVKRLAAEKEARDAIRKETPLLKRIFGKKPSAETVATKKKEIAAEKKHKGKKHSKKPKAKKAAKKSMKKSKRC